MIGIGNPLFKEEDIVNYLPDQPGIKMPFTAKLGFLWTILTHIPQLISNRPSVLVSRTHAVCSHSLWHSKCCTQTNSQPSSLSGRLKKKGRMTRLALSGMLFNVYI